MANFFQYVSTLFKHEGGYNEIPGDRGGATNLGITIQTWMANGYDKDGDGDIDKRDLSLITPMDAAKIAKKNYWDPIAGDYIKSQSIAEFLFDWGYNSGVRTAIKMAQEVMGLKPDGIVGPRTLDYINKSNPESVFNILKAKREWYVRNIVARKPDQGKFLRGWLNRIHSFKFKG